MKTQNLWATIIGIILLLVGLLGFVMDSPLLGWFGINTLHSVVHLLTGAIFLWAGLSKKGNVAKMTNQWLGVIYIVVAIVGFLGWLTFLMVQGGNDPDNYLHLVVGLVSVLIGWMSK